MSLRAWIAPLEALNDYLLDVHVVGRNRKAHLRRKDMIKLRICATAREMGLRSLRAQISCCCGLGVTSVANLVDFID